MASETAIPETRKPETLNPKRIALGVEYDGSRFRGFQRQLQRPTVQQALEDALMQVAQHPVRVHCAGRTDTGVHAVCQVIHFETSAERSERSWVLGCNTYLPDGVSALWARTMDDDFHARFSARARRYRYRILNRWIRPGLLAGRVAWERRKLDAAGMHEAAQYLAGEHDFSSFRALHCQASHATRTIRSIKIWRENDQVLIDVAANAFLYHMVRNMAGTLIAVGCGDQKPEWVQQVLMACDRAQAGITAPAEGLYFVGAEYPDYPELPVFEWPDFPRGWNLS